ncbi:MAG: hypothetical protein ACMZ64_05480 [Oleiphilus sp.]
MIIFDIEASGLSNESYPIEIAWQDSDNPKDFDSFLIKPAETWSHWDNVAEKHVHHITREVLFDSGVTAKDACERLNEKLLGRMIYSDAITYDQKWIYKLFFDSCIIPNFRLGSIYDVIDSRSLELLERSIENEYVAHRALSDVQQIIRMLNEEQ